jgi:hypothetical protein
MLAIVAAQIRARWHHNIFICMEFQDWITLEKLENGVAMTILHIMQCTNLGGMEQVAFRVMGELAREYKIKFRIVTPTPFGSGKSRVLEFDPTSRDFPYRGRFGWRDFWQFRARVRELANECSHVWITGTSAAALAAVKGIGLPVVL